MKEIRYSAGPISLAAIDNGGKGPMILGLHGFLDNSASLIPIMKRLDDFHFVALELAGHGKSEHRPPGCHYDQAGYLQDLFAVIQQYNLKDILLLGHSLGGILATTFAALFPEFVRAVITIDACGPLTREPDTTASQMRASVLSRVEKQRSKATEVDLDRAIQARCSISDIRPDHARAILLRNLKTDCQGNLLWASDPRLRTLSTLRMTQAQAESLIRSISCPVWVAGASNSFKQLKQVYASRAGWLKQGSYMEFQGGHHVHMEQPDAISQAIRDFVGQM
ncbi:alpha/beta hydrolase [Alteromonas aestuariivivens]|uniref:Alpha/beta hydrolase n=1 Tax=Alteromonas aestuariivivens TaxID=1938339 RepID=A0A3D8M530_9ALTE|nr:alpha/beta hydrolase [Alteromonas aestuariivivens]RDV24644.1 alpha/beta hydrolase [Alteromonas aestuariivivens]